MYEAEYSPHFVREYKKLPLRVKISAERKIPLLLHDPFDARLKTHKLSGRLSGYFAFWIDYRYRIIFSITDTIVRLHSAGDHSIYE
jgi:addiction module RelE/StbE family toxin